MIFAYLKILFSRFLVRCMRQNSGSVLVCSYRGLYHLTLLSLLHTHCIILYKLFVIFIQLYFLSREHSLVRKMINWRYAWGYRCLSLIYTYDLLVYMLVFNKYICVYTSYYAKVYSRCMSI